MERGFSRKVLFAVSFLVIGIIIASFVFSQPGGTLSNGQPTTNAWHTADQIWCSGCVTTSSLAGDAVTSTKILDEEIIDQDVSFGAAINPQKIKGVNGFYGSVSGLASAPLDLPLSETWGISTWAGRRLETVCDTGVSLDTMVFNGMISFTGAGQYYNRIFNHYVVVIPQVGLGVNLGGSLGNGWTKVYQADTYAISTNSNPDVLQGSRSLYMRVSTTDASKIQVGQTNTGTGYSSMSSWKCLVKFVS